MLLNCCGGIIPNDKQYDRYAKLVEEIEEKCLKKSRHVPPKDAIYETPSDYDPLALNMGQLVVHRISLRFCDAVIPSIIVVIALFIFVLGCYCHLDHQVVTIPTSRCKCDPSQLQYGERCGKVLPFKHQVGGYKISCEFVMTFRHF